MEKKLEWWVLAVGAIAAVNLFVTLKMAFALADAEAQIETTVGKVDTVVTPFSTIFAKIFS